MFVTYRDEAGYITVDIDFWNVQFLNGEAYFSSNNEEYRINILNIVEIGRY